jgi:glycosyltransferase involved in cell wall biosynthesis
MINVLFDHQTFSTQRYGGISRYFANIYHHINLQNYIQSDISILSTENQYIQEYPAILNNQLGKLIMTKPNRRFKWNKVYSKYRIKKNDFDILHPTYYQPYFLKDIKKPYVITVHDMIHEIYPEFFESGDPTARYKRLCVENASHIIAISESTKSDLIKYLNIRENDISVIHHGCDSQLSFQSAQNIAILPFDYLLYVGDRKGYKNWPRFVNAISPLLQKNKSMKLVCAGGGPLMAAEQELLHRLRITEQVQHHSVSDATLSSLYQNALAFIYPSLYEGFGLPILEAFQNQCPVIASNTPCFREVGGNAIFYFDPTNENDMLLSITSLIDSKEKRKHALISGQAMLPQYAMEHCLNKTLAVYRNIHS